MNTDELRKELPPVAIWMADAAIRQARKALCGKTGWPKPDRSDYNLPEVEMAGAVLFRLFHTYQAAIESALINMPEKLDGVFDYHGMYYFDEFVKALSKYIEPDVVTIRQSDWVLESL